jgi:hypothetical protein
LGAEVGGRGGIGVHGVLGVLGSHKNPHSHPKNPNNPITTLLQREEGVEAAGSRFFPTIRDRGTRERSGSLAAALPKLVSVRQ